MQYIIQAGDALSKIAARFKVPPAVLLTPTKQIVNPDQLQIGQD